MAIASYAVRSPTTDSRSIPYRETMLSKCLYFVVMRQEEYVELGKFDGVAED